jgi:hypothetical protein
MIMGPRMDGGAEGDRTLDLCIANAALSQLSYRPTNPAKLNLARARILGAMTCKLHTPALARRPLRRA